MVQRKPVSKFLQVQNQEQKQNTMLSTTNQIDLKQKDQPRP